MTMDPAKPMKRAPKGYVRGALKEFTITGADGHSLPPIKVQCYIHRSNGRVRGYGLSTGLAGGMLEAATMTEWEKAVTKTLRAQIAGSKPTRHIAVVATSDRGKYRLAFWPVWRQKALDGTEHWAEVQSAGRASSWLTPADEIDWVDKHRNWSNTQPWIWEESRTDATILDWSPETWDGLVAIRQSLDDAIAKIGELVTDPLQLTAHAQRLLGPGDDDG